MGIDIKELRIKIEDQKFAYTRAQSIGMMVNQETERMKNILMNNLAEIVDALKVAEGAEEKIKMLEAEVESADAELKELDDEIRRLREEAAKPASKKKPRIMDV